MEYTFSPNCAFSPTFFRRMRYNVSYSDITEDPVKELRMLTADISPVVGANLEFDVPQFNNLPLDQIKEDMPTVQRLVREGPFNQLFKIEFFGGDYDGPDTVRIFRCVGHLHVAAIGMWLEDAVTGENICANIGNYGTDPTQDNGFLNGLTVESFDTPVVIPADHPVRLVSEYDATVLHTGTCGCCCCCCCLFVALYACPCLSSADRYYCSPHSIGVMGMWFLFIDAERNVTRLEADLTVELCEASTCDDTVLPVLEPMGDVCEDELGDSPLCRFAGICDCEDFINAPSSTGCNGVYSSPQGDVEVNSLCQKSCDCPDSGSVPAAGGCEDALAGHPACTFGGMCSCQDLVDNPESGGCGGVLENAAGDIVINDVCAAFCDACPEVGSADAVMEENMVEQLEEVLASTCFLATEECRRTLNALYTCGTQMQAQVGTETLASQFDIPSASTRGGHSLASAPTESVNTDMGMDSTMQTIVKKHGSRLALEYAKLGHPSLHVGQPDQVVGKCGAENKTDTGSQADEKDDETAASAVSAGREMNLFASMAAVVSMVILVAF